MWCSRAKQCQPGTLWAKRNPITLRMNKYLTDRLNPYFSMSYGPILLHCRYRSIQASPNGVSPAKKHTGASRRWSNGPSASKCMNQIVNRTSDRTGRRTSSIGPKQMRRNKFEKVAALFQRFKWATYPAGAKTLVVKVGSERVFCCSWCKNCLLQGVKIAWCKISSWETRWCMLTPGSQISRLRVLVCVRGPSEKT